MRTPPTAKAAAAVRGTSVHRGEADVRVSPGRFIKLAEGYPALGDLSHPSLDCATCTRYRAARAHVLPAAIYRYAGRRQMHPSDLFNTFMTGVHARHLAGLPLGTE